MNKIIKLNKKYNDITVSPVIRQVLQHWGYKLTSGDLNSYKKSKNKDSKKKVKRSKRSKRKTN